MATQTFSLNLQKVQLWKNQTFELHNWSILSQFLGKQK